MKPHPNTEFPESHPCHHTAAVKSMLAEMIEHVKEDTGKFEEPRAQALFETSADVLMGLYTAFDRYEQAERKVMRNKVMRAPRDSDEIRDLNA